MLLTLLALAIGAAHAGDVLVPEATPAQLSDFSVAYLFYDMVVSQLRDQGIAVQDADVIRGWAESDADACWDNPDCPRLLWDRDAGGSALVVLGVGQTANGLEVNARIYKAGETEPTETVHEIVPGGSEERLAVRISGLAVQARDAAGDDEPARIAPARTLNLDDDAPPSKPSDEKPVKSSDEKPEKAEKAEKAEKPEKPRDEKPIEHKPKAPDAPRDTAGEERAHMGVPAWSYAKFRESGLARGEWLKQKRVHTGKVSLEVLPGYGIGDVDRGYGVRVAVGDPGGGYETLAASTVQGPGAGHGFSGAIAVTYTPAWFLETSLQLGLLTGQKHLNVGWECTSCDSTTDVSDYDPVNSMQGFIEPRARILPLATGYVKPYALVGLHVRLWDGFSVPDGSSVDYPNVPGGAGVGLAVGGGVSFDVLPQLSILVEVPYVITLSDGASEEVSADVTAVPTALEPASGLLRITGGLAVHF